MAEARTRPWDQAQAEQLVAEVIEARLASFGKAEWPDGQTACQKLGKLYDKVDGAWLAKDLAALETAGSATLVLIVQLGLQNAPKPSERFGGTVSSGPCEERA
jgi:hypothetical protein